MYFSVSPSLPLANVFFLLGKIIAKRNEFSDSPVWWKANCPVLEGLIETKRYVVTTFFLSVDRDLFAVTLLLALIQIKLPCLVWVREIINSVVDKERRRGKIHGVFFGDV